MSWYPDLHIGELRPWPDAVYVWRGKTGESQRYLPDDFCALARENNELRTERDTYRDLVGCMDHPDLNVQLQAENAKLREACAELLKMAECHDPEWLHWPEMHDELRKLGVEVDG